MKFILNYFCFLILNHIDLHYVYGCAKLDWWFSKIRINMLKNCGAQIGENSLIRAHCTIVNPKNFIVGKNCKIGARCRIMNFANVAIGDDVEIGADCVFQTNEHIITDTKQARGKQGAVYNKISLGNGCYVGAGVTFLNGVSVEDRIVIGARALVTKDLSEIGTYVGIPAKIVSRASKRNMH